MKHYCIASCILILTTFFSVDNLQAQIAIDRSFFESQKGKTYAARDFKIDLTKQSQGVTTNVNSIITQVGANKVFDFRNLPFPTQPTYLGEIRYLANGESHPFTNQPITKEANFIGKSTSTESPDTTAWSYMLLSNDSLSILASGFTVANSNETFFGPLSTLGAVSEPLPQSYGTEWEVIFFELDSPPTRQVSKGYYTIDAWGTLLLPGGRSIPALRERIDTEVFFFLNGQEFPALGTPRTTVGYTFNTLDGHSARIFLELDPEQNKYVPVEVAYSIQSVKTNTSIGGDPQFLPEGFSLLQNYPNPFNPSTQITYSIPFTSDVTFRISDVTGRILSESTFTQVRSGEHTFTFNAQNLSSGIYIYSIEAGGYTMSKMLTLVK